MAFDFKFPDVGEGIAEGRIVEWLVSAGDRVAADQPMVRVETDKAVVELPSPKSGTVLALHFGKGDIIHVGDVIATLGEEGEGDTPSGAREERTTSVRYREQVTALQVEKRAEDRRSSPRPLATPHTRALARKLGVELSTIKGSGRGGRITDEDVEKASTVKPRQERAPLLETGPKEEERIPISHLRHVIAESMSLSVRTAAQVTHFDETDVTDLIALQKRLAEKIAASGGPRLTLLPFFIRALVGELKAHPKFNAVHDPEKNELVYRKYYNIGIAVDTAEGLIVPVVKNADRKSLLDLTKETSDLAARARERTLSLEEIQGGTCTLTNIGPVGGLFATPIIHQPELAVAAFMEIKRRPVVRDNEIVARSMMYVGVSFDHRFIDGAEAARFTRDLCAALADPDLLLARI